MAATRTILARDWALVNTSGTDFTLQVLEGGAEVTFETSAPATTDFGFRLGSGQGVTQDYGTGNCYVRGDGTVMVMT